MHNRLCFRLAESNRAVWKFTELSQHSENHGVGSLRARLEVTNGPGSQGTIATQFNCEGTTLSGVEFDLVGAGYRLSLVKRRFVSGEQEEYQKFWFLPEFIVCLNPFLIVILILVRIMNCSPHLKCSSLLKGSEIENTGLSHPPQQMSSHFFT